MKSILDKSFRYTPAARTDLAATFRRIRKEQRESESKKAPVTDFLARKAKGK